MPAKEIKEVFNMEKLNDRKSEEGGCIECLRPEQIIQQRDGFPAIYIAVGSLEESYTVTS